MGQVSKEEDGGLVGAGRRVLLAEAKDLGGTCVNDGCTPTKTMIASARAAHVARHAGPARATVRVCYQPGAVVLEIADTGRGRSAGAARPAGHGIAGMRERAAAVGGMLEAGPNGDGGFLVRARLPFEGDYR